jgi:FG-GAP-like repeat/Abnormal spindle-like microcephaly-assoc'd, ASPM-SPD-2-Hydin/FG-GAP repeat
MNSIYRKFGCSDVAAVALTLLAALVLLAGIVIPAQAQTHPPAFFQYPSTFEINGIVNFNNLLGVQAAAVGDFNGDGKLDIVSIMGGGWEIDVAPGNGDGTFQVPILNTYSFPSNTSPYALTVGDFNGDAKLDLAVWCTYAPGNYNEVIIFLGNGNGTFTYNNTHTAPNAYGNPGSNSLYVADFNGDGKLDLAALAPYCASNLPCVAVYLGKGDGTFQTPVLYSTLDPNHPNNYNAYGMAVGDLTGDGKPDIAVTQSNGMVVLLNNGNGTFGTATYYDNGLSHQSETGIAIGDVNGDKKNDILTSAYLGDVVLFLNQGSGTFALKGSIGKAGGGGQGSWLVAMADINGDKKLDLVVSDWYGEIWTFYGKGNGTFTAGPVYPVQFWEQPPDNMILADFNGDGALDIFKPLEGHSWDGQVILGRSDGTFQTNQAYGWTIPPGNGGNMVTADFNGDGFPDVAYGYARSANLTQAGFEVMLGSSHGVLGAPTFVSVINCGWWTEWIAAGDVNGDGKADIVATINNNCVTSQGQVAVMTGLGTGKFKAPVYYSTGSTAQPVDVFLEDVTGDGKPDMVISNWDGTISILLNKGNGTFGTASVITSVAAFSPHLHALSFGDFNGDGKLDIAAATYYPQDQSATGSNVYILLGNGNGTFQAPITTAAAPQYVYTSTLAAGDFNKDGKTDLLVTVEGSTGCSDYYGAAAYIYLKGNGNGTFNPGSLICTGGDYPQYPVVADFNGDGKLDAFIPMLENYGRNPYGPPVLEGNGDGTFTTLGESEYQWVNGLEQEVLKGGFYVGPTNRGAVVADFNGDGTPDIAVLNADNYAIGDSVTFVTVMQNSTQPVSVSPLNLNFGSVAVGAAKSLTVILTNDQTTTLTINSIAVASGTGDFTATQNCGSSRKAGWECTITVKFKPSVLGAQTGTLTVKDSAGTQTVQLIAVNPKPTITSLSPSSATHGGAGFTLTVNGTGFINSSVVNWNGSPRATTYVSSTEVTATITAADIAKAGSFKVTVTNPAPGGGTSAAKTFTVN